MARASNPLASISIIVPSNAWARPRIDSARSILRGDFRKAQATLQPQDIGYFTNVISGLIKHQSGIAALGSTSLPFKFICSGGLRPANI